VTGSPSISTPAPVGNAATVAGGWLARQFNSAGNLPPSEGAAGIDNLPLALVALVASGTNPPEVTTGLAYLEAHFERYVQLPTKSKGGKASLVDAPGRLAEVILAAVATSADPTRFGGTAPSNDLVSRLVATETTSGPDHGLFGSPNAPTYSSAFTQGLAVLALTAAAHPDPAAAAWLVSQQCSDGGWTSYRSSTTTACPAPDPKTYAGADTNSTALAVEALTEAKVAMTHDPVSFFARSQYPNGGFSYYGVVSKSQKVDPDSTALVLQALIALGATGKPAFGSTTAAGRTQAALSTFQLACGASVADRGAFTYPGTKGPSLLATIQAIPAAAGLASPVRTGDKGTPIPLAACAAGMRDGSHAAAPPASGPHPARSAPAGARRHRPRHRPASVTLTAYSSAVAGWRRSATLRPHCGSVPRPSSGDVVVPVVIDSGAASQGAVTVTCVAVPSGGSGATALAAAARALGEPAPVYASSGLLCSIGGYPATGCGTATGGRYAYWAYYHGGTRWSYAENGPAANSVGAGDVEGWRFQPDGSATPADPPPRAASSVQSLEAGSTAAGAAAAAAGGVGRSGAARGRPSGGSGGAGGTSALQVGLVAAGALLAAVALAIAFVRTRRAGALS
jgi:hypothetical protein